MTEHHNNHTEAPNLRDAVLARASKPSKAGSKVVAVRVPGPTFERLQEAALQAGIKPADIVRAAIEEFTKE
jgi:hypothetical protein